MRTIFKSYLPQTETDRAELWQSSIIALDTNVLLNFYRFSDSLRKAFLKVLSTNRERFWLPNRIVDEFLRNRLTVVDHQIYEYNTMITQFDIIRKKLNDDRHHPFVRPETLAKLDAVLQETREELNQHSHALASTKTVDPTLNDLLTLFENKVGRQFDSHRRQEVEKLAAERIRKKVPPGYLDTSYGDIILWFQLMDKAKEDKKNLIFVTEDAKVDWWWYHKPDKKETLIGPRPELISEFFDQTGCSFYMYSSSHFLQLANEFLNQDITDSNLAEIREIEELNKERSFQRVWQQDNLDGLSDECWDLQHKINDREEYLGDIQHELSRVRSDDSLGTHEKNEQLVSHLELYMNIKQELEQFRDSLKGKLTDIRNSGYDLQGRFPIP